MGLKKNFTRKSYQEHGIPETQVCRICLKEKHKEEFLRKYSNKNGLDTRCKSCVSLVNKQYRDKYKNFNYLNNN